METHDDFLDNLNAWALESIATIALDTRLNLFEGKDKDAVRLFTVINNSLKLISFFN
jgi:hypothetical protein